MRSTVAGRECLAWRVSSDCAAGRVHEATPTPPYEDEGSTRESRGAVSLAGGAWWSATLRVPAGEAESVAGSARAAQLRLVRHAPLGASSGDVDVELSLPAAEVDAVARLLAGVAAQARRDGTLPAAPRA